MSYRLSCPTAHGISSDQGSDPCALPWRVDFDPLSHQGVPSSPSLIEAQATTYCCVSVASQVALASGKAPACQCRRRKRCGFGPWVRKILWRRKWQPTPVFLPGESHGQRSLAGYSPWGHKEWDTTEAI